MDQTAIIVHLLSKIDAQTETLRRIEVLLTACKPEKASVKETSSRSPGKAFAALSPFWQSISAGLIMWAFGIALRAYFERGGSPILLMETLLRLL